MENKFYTLHSVSTIGTILKNSRDQQFKSSIEQLEDWDKLEALARTTSNRADINYVTIGSRQYSSQESAKEAIMLGTVSKPNMEELIYNHFNQYMESFGHAEKYEKTFETVLTSKANITLILLKWIAQLQIVTKDTVIIDTNKLKLIGVSLSVEQVHQLFLDAFQIRQIKGSSYNTEFTLLKMDNGKLHCKVGTRAMVSQSGPGFIKLGFDGKICDIIEKCIEHVKEEKLKADVKALDKK